MAHVRIKDIAKKAGVSVGTVDRVLHGRGKVSKQTEERIKQAIKSLNYTPNLAARGLASKLRYRIAAVIPKHPNDDFWSAQLRGIKRAENGIKDFGFLLDYYDFNDQEIGGLKKLTSKIVTGDYHAVLVAPTLKKDAEYFLRACERSGIYYVQINSFLERENLHFLGYVGQDSYRSGKLAAKLLDITTRGQRTFSCVHLEKNVEMAEHLRGKARGFMDYFDENPNPEIRTVIKWIPNFENASGVTRSIKHLVTKEEDLAGIFVTTSRIHLVAKVLLRLGRTDVVLVGFDLIEKNIGFLESYQRMFLINQNPSLQGFYGVMNIFNFLFKKKQVPHEKFLPLDVVTYENASNYLHIEERDTTQFI